MMKKLIITAASVLGLTTMAMGQTSTATADKPAVSKEERGKSCDKKGWGFWGKKRSHRHGMGKILMQSEPIRTALAEQAKAQGHDMTTRAGKKAFFKGIREKKKAWIKGQGVDSRAKRREFRQKLKANQKAEADKLGYNLDSLAGKEQYALFLIKNDRSHELAMRGHGRRHHKGSSDR